MVRIQISIIYSVLSHKMQRVCRSSQCGCTGGAGSRGARLPRGARNNEGARNRVAQRIPMAALAAEEPDSVPAAARLGSDESRQAAG